MRKQITADSRGSRAGGMTTRTKVLTVSVGMVLAAACTLAATNAWAAAPRGGGAAAAPKPTIVAPDSDKGDSSKSKELPTYFTEENTGAKYPRPTKYATMEDGVVIKPFPDPFAYANDPLGKTRSTAYADWEKHRQEMMALIEHYEIGPKPVVDKAKQVTATFTPVTPAAGAMGNSLDDMWFVAAPAGPAAGAAGGADAPAAPGGRRGRGGAGGAGGAPRAGGAAGGPGGGGGRGRGGAPGGPGSGTLVIKVTGPGEPLTLTCNITVPVGAKAPYPVLITMGGSSLPAAAFASRGIAVVSYNYNSVSQDGQPKPDDAFHKLYPDQKLSSKTVDGDTGQYSAWAWGASRVIDGLEITKDKFPVDLAHISVTGCSRAGKLALFAGAFDERIAFTAAQESGGGGATNWRFSATEPVDPTNPAKLSVEGATNTDHAWFSTTLFQWGNKALDKMPEDHNMLTALVAPRALYVTGNTDFTWLSNVSLYVNSRATARVYSTLGVADRFGYVVNGQHGHCQFPASQESDLAYFLDRFIKDDKTLSKYVANVPEEFAKVDYERWTKWWGTGSADLPPLKEGAWK